MDGCKEAPHQDTAVPAALWINVPRLLTQRPPLLSAQVTFSEQRKITSNGEREGDERKHHMASKIQLRTQGSFKDSNNLSESLK